MWSTQKFFIYSRHWQEAHNIIAVSLSLLGTPMLTVNHIAVNMIEKVVFNVVFGYGAPEEPQDGNAVMKSTL